MKALIAGPTDITKVERFGNIGSENYSPHLEQIARTMLDYVEVVNLIPDKGVPLDFAKFFRSLGGKIVGYVPSGGCPQLQENFQCCDEILEFDAGWNGLNTCLSLKGDLITVLGMSPGTIVEIAYTKYHNKYLKKRIPILIDEQSLTTKVPEEIAEELEIYYFSNPIELGKLLENIRRKLR